jgi:hypothetical protein
MKEEEEGSRITKIMMAAISAMTTITTTIQSK